MKNLIALFTLATFLFLTSCAKEAIIQPDATPETVTEIQAKQSFAKMSIGGNYEEQGGANTIAVTTDSYSIEDGELIVEFSSTHDFSNDGVDATQQLEFVDGDGNSSTLTFQVNSSDGGNGYLDVTFAVGGNDLTDLGLEVEQGIVVEEIVME